jgi:ABC-type multidrug transport system ATPase subunit
MGDAGAAIEARALGKRYGKFDALRGIDLEIPRGSIYGVLGPRGAGKTTLVKCVGLIARHTAGQLTVLGNAITRRDSRLRDRIGYMPQQAALYEELSARFNVEFFGRGVARDRIEELLAMVGLGDRADDAVSEFSGGMKQRVSLACTLAREPELLLLDEPTAGIDPVLRISMWEEFRRLRDAGKTLLVSTHQIDEANHCDRLLIIRDGMLLVEGTPEALLGRGGATVVATVGDDRHERRFDEPRRDLPRFIAELGAEAIDTLDVHHDSLEHILVELIRAKERE